MQSRHYQIVLRTFGTLTPRTQTTLIPQVSGMVVEVAEAFHNGGYFSKGDRLLRIDDSDYRIAVRNAEAPLLKARAALAEERARGKQAAEEWKSLNRKNKPNALVLRIPQAEAAKAEVLAAEAQVERTKLDLRRTNIIAPYDGRVQNTQVDVGQYVAAGTSLANIFASDVLEVRLPLNSAQLAHIRLPERRRDEQSDEAFFTPVDFFIEQGGRRWQYPGQIVRTESEIDTSTRQLFVVGEIQTPFGNSDSERPLPKIGQFVEAGITADKLDDVYVIPRRLLLQGDQVLLAIDGQVTRRQVSVVWRDERDAVIDKGLVDGELLITTPLGDAVSGTRIDYPGVAH